MSRTIIQVPMSLDLKNAAAAVADDMGFSSLQEVIRVLLTKFAKRQIVTSFQEPVVLSPKNDRRYDKMTQDFKNKKQISPAFDHVDDLIKSLSQ